MESFPVTIKRIGGNIRKHRMQKDFKQEFLAKKIGLSKSALSRIENGNRNTTIHKILLVAYYLEIHPKELFE